MYAKKKLHTKGLEHWIFWLNFLLGVYSAGHILPVSIELSSTNRDVHTRKFR